MRSVPEPAGAAASRRRRRGSRTVAAWLLAASCGGVAATGAAAARTAPADAPAATSAPAPAPAAASAPIDAPAIRYATRMPPATTLRYAMQRGMLRGVGELAWRPQGERYALSLEARVAGLKVLTQASIGAIDDAGIAPRRFSDERIGRSGTAAVLDRTAGRITFVGSDAAFALRDGTQDRLSWMIQLGAIVAADPQLAAAGTRIAMDVVGSHGDLSVWTFRCDGVDAVETGAGRVDAIRFTREKREPSDTTVQIWLDPQRHALPVRALQKQPDDEPFDLRLQAVVAGG